MNYHSVCMMTATTKVGGECSFFTKFTAEGGIVDEGFGRPGGVDRGELYLIPVCVTIPVWRMIRTSKRLRHRSF